MVAEQDNKAQSALTVDLRYYYYYYYYYYTVKTLTWQRRRLVLCIVDVHNSQERQCHSTWLSLAHEDNTVHRHQPRCQSCPLGGAASATMTSLPPIRDLIVLPVSHIYMYVISNLLRKEQVAISYVWETVRQMLLFASQNGKIAFRALLWGDFREGQTDRRKESSSTDKTVSAIGRAVKRL